MGQTLAEKILQRNTKEKISGAGQIVQCKVDLVLANDITAPLAIKSFRRMEAKKVFDNERIAIVCDHFTPSKDIDSAEQVKLSRQFAHEFNIKHFYEGGSAGIEHALLPELGLIGPGQVIIGADSHTCTYGAFGAFGTGMGSTDIAAAMVLGENWFKVPPSIRAEFLGSLDKFVSAKDMMIHLIGQIGVSGALYRAIEFVGPAIEALSMEGRMTIANMAIEAGGKAGLFAADQKTLDYCKTVGRKGDEKISGDADAVYERRVTINMSGMEPQIACPHSPDNVKPISQVKNVKVDQVVIGSCTNGRIEDIREAANLLKGRHVHKDVRLIVIPATPQIWKQAMTEGHIATFMDAGAIVGPPTCGPCLGGHMGILAADEVCLATTNRNFKGRMGSLAAQVYLANPAVAAATAIAGEVIHPKHI